jgi:hypothetical protein
VKRVLDALLNVADGVARVALVPAPVEVFCGGPELDHQDAGQVFGTDLPSFFSPQPDQGPLVVPHDYPGIRAANEFAAIA